MRGSSLGLHEGPVPTGYHAELCRESAGAI